jgi:hypothetical protein
MPAGRVMANRAAVTESPPSRDKGKLTKKGVGLIKFESRPEGKLNSSAFKKIGAPIFGGAVIIASKVSVEPAVPVCGEFVIAKSIVSA